MFLSIAGKDLKEFNIDGWVDSDLKKYEPTCLINTKEQLLYSFSKGSPSLDDLNRLSHLQNRGKLSFNWKNEMPLDNFPTR
jgi:hypothetical protein